VSGYPRQRGGPVFTGGRAAVLAAVRQLQGGRCAVCRQAVPLEADHDHATGLLRGMLCRPCNVAEGKAISALTSYVPDPRLEVYRANPPAACLAWLWDWPQVDRMSIDQAIEALAATELPPLQGQRGGSHAQSSGLNRPGRTGPTRSCG
jgi:hypothetical protein